MKDFYRFWEKEYFTGLVPYRAFPATFRRKIARMYYTGRFMRVES